MEDKWKRNTQHNEDKRNSTTLLDMQEEELLQNSHATAREESHFTTAEGWLKEQEERKEPKHSTYCSVGTIWHFCLKYGCNFQEIGLGFGVKNWFHKKIKK